MSSINVVQRSSILKNLFFRNRSLFRPVHKFTLNAVVKIEFKRFFNDKVKKPVYGVLVGSRKNGGDSTISVLYSVEKLRIIETFPVYSKFIKKIVIFDVEKRKN